MQEVVEDKVIKIGHQPELPGTVVHSGPAKQAQAAASAADGLAKSAPAASASRAPSTVTFSRSARDLEPPGRAAGDFDAVRVKAMRAAIDAGTFRIDASAIADKLLSNAQEVLSRMGRHVA